MTEYYAHNIASGYVMLRTGSYKYTYHTRMDEKHPPMVELYDLATDPGEFKSLADDPTQKERIASMHARLVAEVGEDPDETDLRCRADYAKGYGRQNPAASKTNQAKSKGKKKQKAK